MLARSILEQKEQVTEETIGCLRSPKLAAMELRSFFIFSFRLAQEGVICF